MKKIMFNDKLMLTQAVLDGRKTQTRRVITYPKTFHGKDVCGYYVCRRATDRAITEVCMYDENESFIDEGQILPKYKVGEIVAVAQSYKYLGFSDGEYTIHKELGAGWNNKMFVKPELMPHQIRITNVRIERLQDISDEDCLKESVVKCDAEDCNNRCYLMSKCDFCHCGNAKYTPREAYAALIDKVGKKGTWDSNPYVFVYDFELVK